MRKRKVFRETVITVIVIALCGKLWFVICKAMVSLYQNYELELLTGFVFCGCWNRGLSHPVFWWFPKKAVSLHRQKKKGCTLYIALWAWRAVCNLNEHAKVEMTLACFFCFYNWRVACCKSMDSARSVPWPRKTMMHLPKNAFLFGSVKRSREVWLPLSVPRISAVEEK